MGPPERGTQIKLLFAAELAGARPLLLAVVSMGWAWSGSAFPPGTLPFAHADPMNRAPMLKKKNRKNK